MKKPSQQVIEHPAEDGGVTLASATELRRPAGWEETISSSSNSMIRTFVP